MFGQPLENQVNLGIPSKTKNQEGKWHDSTAGPRERFASLRSARKELVSSMRGTIDHEPSSGDDDEEKPKHGGRRESEDGKALGGAPSNKMRGPCPCDMSSHV